MCSYFKDKHTLYLQYLKIRKCNYDYLEKILMDQIINFDLSQLKYENIKKNDTGPLMSKTVYTWIWSHLLKKSLMENWIFLCSMPQALRRP